MRAKDSADRTAAPWSASATGIRAKHLDHVTIVVADLEQTREFYVRHLGLREIDRPAFSFPGLWFEAGATQIHVTLSNAESGAAGWADRGATEPSRGHHFAFEVDDARQAARSARQAGIEIAAGPKLRPDGYVQVYLYDPDRHLVELFSAPEKS